MNLADELRERTRTARQKDGEREVRERERIVGRIEDSGWEEVLAEVLRERADKGHDSAYVEPLFTHVFSGSYSSTEARILSHYVAEWADNQGLKYNSAKLGLYWS